MIAVQPQSIPSEKIFQPDTTYSRNGLSVVDKLAKQLGFALLDPRGWAKAPGPDFKIAIPSILLIDSMKQPFSSGVWQEKGSKNYQEDRYLRDALFSVDWQGKEVTGRLFAVFDGHKDSGRAGEFLAQHLPSRLGEILTEFAKDAAILDEEVVTKALAAVFPILSHSYRKGRMTGGTTVTCALIFDGKIYFPNVGDSRTILVKEAYVCQMTEDADSISSRFQKWHVNMGNWINGNNRVESPKRGPGKLSVARNIGHWWMCSRPKITRIFIDNQPDDKNRPNIYCGAGDYLVLASDGLFHCAHTLDVGRAVRQLAQEKVSPQMMATLIAKKAASYERSDNVTVMVVRI